MHSTLTADLAPLSSVVALRPMLMLTGFLGAGKTTFLRSLLDDLATQEHPIMTMTTLSQPPASPFFPHLLKEAK